MATAWPIHAFLLPLKVVFNKSTPNFIFHTAAKCLWHAMRLGDSLVTRVR